jgi:3-deoxy-7-phosphoheptulonate synthase
VRDGVDLPSYRGDIVNDIAFDLAARTPDPTRLLRAYHQSTSTLNLVRAFTKGGFADLRRVHQWNQEFVATSREGQQYELLAAEIDRALHFMNACGIDLESELTFRTTDFYTSHEALILGYEEALTRVDTLTGDWYDCSAHMLWLGDRTRQLDGAHVEFLAGVHNPIGVKLGPSATPTEVVALCDRLDPNAEPGRLVLIARMGIGRINAVLPGLLQAVRDSGHPVAWACDPMHGNTFVHSSGYKTRRFDDVLEELRRFVAVCHSEGVWPGGVHIELTGDDVTECLGGAEAVLDEHLEQRYETMCDPRLNARQSLDLAFQVAELLRDSAGSSHR